MLMVRYPLGGGVGCAGRGVRLVEYEGALTRCRSIRLVYNYPFSIFLVSTRRGWLVASANLIAA